MGKVKTSWLTPGHSGRPCRHEDIYTKMNKKTGQVYSVKLCNPYAGKASADQLAQRNTFGATNSAISAWIKQNKADTAADHNAYLQVKAAFDRQTKCSTLRGYMIAKGMATLQSDGSVTISFDNYTTTIATSAANHDAATGTSDSQNASDNSGSGATTPSSTGGDGDNESDDEGNF